MRRGVGLIVVVVLTVLAGRGVASSIPSVRVISHAGNWTPPSPWA